MLQAQVLEADDPRVAWAAQNRAALQQREQAEAAKKVELLSAAKEYLDKVYKVRLEPTYIIVELLVARYRCERWGRLRLQYHM
jgi:hypothetical protein